MINSREATAIKPSSFGPSLALAIAQSVEIIVSEDENGIRVVRGMDTATVNRIANAVMTFLRNPPIDDRCDDYIAGLYSRTNIEAFVRDLERQMS